LTSPDLEEARAILSHQATSFTSSGSSGEFLNSLFPGLSCSVSAALSIAFLAGAYPLAADIIVKLTEQPLIADMSASVVELGQVVSLLEAPVFAGLRLQLLTPHRCPGLLRALYSLLLVLPQGEAFRLLKTRLDCVRTSGGGDDHGLLGREEEKENKVCFDKLLAIFVNVQTRKLASMTVS
jgi:vacuole morphology and inheritance protein 14